MLDTCFRRLKVASMIAEAQESRVFAKAKGSQTSESHIWAAHER